MVFSAGSLQLLHTRFFLSNNKTSLLTRHVFVKHRCPRRQQSPNMAKISKSYILTPPHPQGCVMSMKSEQPIDEHTVKIWLLYHNPNFKYCTLIVSGTELWTDGRTDRQTDGRTFQAGGHKNFRQTFIVTYMYGSTVTTT